MIRLALPKGRNLAPVVAVLRAAGYPLAGLDEESRRLRLELPAEGLEVMLLRDWDLPLYVEHGIADCGVVGADVLDEVDGDLLVPLAFRAPRCRLSLIGRPGTLPAGGSQARLATKYVETARRWLATRAWSAEVVALSGSVELAPVLDLAEVALDIVQTGRTLAEHDLVELEVVREITPRLVVNRAAWQWHRPEILRLVRALERAEAAA